MVRHSSALQRGARIRHSWQQRLASAAQQLAGVPRSTQLTDFRRHADTVLAGVPPPRNQAELILAQGVLTAIVLRQLSFDQQELIRTVLGDQALCLTQAPDELSHLNAEHSLAERARTLLGTDYKTPLSLTALARKFRVHRNDLAREFKAAFSISTHEYVTTRRMLVAAELLVSTTLRVESVANEVGYQSKKNFYRHFRQRFDTTPAQFRARLRQSAPW
jgi:AraC-like DNA-binding protein